MSKSTYIVTDFPSMKELCDAVILDATNKNEFYVTAVKFCKQYKCGIIADFPELEKRLNALRMKAVIISGTHQIPMGWRTNLIRIQKELVHRIMEHYCEEVCGSFKYRWDRKTKKYVEATAFCNNLVESNQHAVNQLSTKKEQYSMKPIKVETRVFVDGLIGKDMSDSDIFAMIADQEKQIEELQKVKAKPKKLVQQIEEMQKGIDDLVKYVDNR